MVERPIIFSGPMVRAILAGTKTQTRRPITKPVVIDWLGQFLPEFVAAPENHLSPYGHAGEQLWVRETTAVWDGKTVYAADDPAIAYELRCTPSIHMPRVACRLVLEVTGLRIERLQDISEEDAKAEGVRPIGEEYENFSNDGPNKFTVDLGGYHFSQPTARECYAGLWDAINEKRGHAWAMNPWVWVIDFVRPQ